MGKKIAIEDAKARLHANGWLVKLDTRYLTAHHGDGSAYQLVPTPCGQIELNDLRKIPSRTEVLAARTSSR
jgi:hypothetical protein